jgi:hypothetical protein
MTEIVKVNAQELKSFGEKNFAPNVVYQSSEIKVVLAYFKKGQFITRRRSTWFCISSKARQRLWPGMNA